MNEKKQNLIKYIFIIIITILICIICFNLIRIIESNISLEEDMISDDMAIISYEGTFEAQGVVVKAEEDMLVIMPTVLKGEHSTQEEFYYETENKLSLKQGQEIEVTFHFSKDSNGYYTDKAIIEEVKILKEKSDIEIPEDVFVKAYSSKDNVNISINEESSTEGKIVFTITDNNEFTYDYSTMEYKLYKYNPPPTKTEVVYTENGAATSGYDPWPEVQKISYLSTKENYTLNEKGEINVDIDLSKIYGKLEEGKYKVILSTVSSPKEDILYSNVVYYPYDMINIWIEFTINSDNKIEYGEINIY